MYIIKISKVSKAINEMVEGLTAHHDGQWWRVEISLNISRWVNGTDEITPKFWFFNMKWCQGLNSQESNSIKG